MRDEFEERERSVGDSVAGDDNNSESPNGRPRWDPTPRVGAVPADVYSSSSEPYISTLPSAPEPVAPEEPATSEAPPTIEEPLTAEHSTPTESSTVAEEPVASETGSAESIAPQIPSPVVTTPLAVRTPPPAPPSPPSPPADDEGDEEEEGMLRMSFMEHLEELRSRILKALGGLVVSFFVSMFFTKDLWRIVSEPAVSALTHLGIKPPELVAITPMEQFNIIWLYMPLLVSVFLGSPWIVYQVWAFISPGLYKREKRWAVPFILCTAGLFITGGVFAYFIAFRYGLEFLLGIGRDVNVRPMVSISEYFDLFVNVTLGVGLVFELPVIIFFLTLLKLASPRFLVRHSRYAILGIVVLAAIVTPTPDVINMMIFAIPMVMLFFVGVFASYLLVLRREGRGIPWKATLLFVLALLLVSGGVLTYLGYRYGYHFVPNWPFFAK
ncbi:MAG: twin-arginine translocase subunit TatC [Bryobacteraceae bacterium]